MTSVSTVFTRVQQSVAVGFHRNQRITRAAPVLDEANVRRIRRTKQNRKQNNMKKLMIAAAAAAMVGGACAANVYDYKASVKYVDFKAVNVKGVGKVYVKQVKSTALKGYLVTPVSCPCEYDTSVSTAFRDQGFLVLTSTSAKKYSKDSSVKLIPANLLASYWSTSDVSKKSKATLEAQGYLFAGIGKADVPAPGSKGEYTKGSPDYCFGEKNESAATRFLFGQFNMEELGTGTFIEPWLDAAGFGKATAQSGTSGSPCEYGTDGDICLTSLSGSVIGGSFTCLPSGVYATGRGYENAAGFVENWLCQGWDIVDQTSALIGTAQVLTGYDYTGCNFLYNVVSGTWSIKANGKIGKTAFSQAELAAQANPDHPWAGTVTDDELQFVKTCGQKLDKNFSLDGFDSKSQYANGFASVWF